MTSNEIPSECSTSKTKDENGGQPKPSSDLTNKSNLSKEDEASQSSSQNSSPVKRNDLETGRQNKSRNRKRNDAKRRSGGHKKQAAAVAANTDQSEKQNPEQEQSESTAIPSDSKLEVHEDEENHQNTNCCQEETMLKNQPDTSNNGEVKIDDESSNRSGSYNKTVFSNGTKDKNKEYKDQLKLQNDQIQSLMVQVNKQASKIKELETALMSTNKTCGQLDKLLQQELSLRKRLETENGCLNQAITRLKNQISIHEKNKFNSDELMRVLNATLMERETEVSILKLKLTRMQTNPSSTMALNSARSVTSMKLEPNQVYASSGRSNSEFDRNSYIRSSMIAEAASIRASTSQLKCNDRDASVWATVPEELTPSKRPIMLEKSFQPIYGDSSQYNSYGPVHTSVLSNTSTPLVRDRRYKTLPRSMKSPTQELAASSSHTKKSEDRDTTDSEDIKQQELPCRVTNLDDSSSTNQESCNKTMNSSSTTYNESKYQSSINDAELPESTSGDRSAPVTFALCKKNQSDKNSPLNALEESHYSTIGKIDINNQKPEPVGTNYHYTNPNSTSTEGPPILPIRTQTTPVKAQSKVKRIFDKFRRADSSSTNSNSKTDLTYSTGGSTTPVSSPFKRNANRSTMVGAPKDIRAQISPVRQVVNFQTDKPFAKWDTDMLVDWLTMIGLSMYTSQCRRWVKCGAHIMNATPAEVDKGLGITNHLHQKKLRLAISELNGDCDKITKAAAKLDYLWVARWLDDIGLPQYKEAFINARVDGRVLNYLTVEDLISMGVKSLLHHASIRCGIKVLRSIQFDLQLLKRRATAEEIEQMNTMRQQIDQSTVSTPLHMKQANLPGDTDVPLWTCHRVMEWLRLIDFAEFAPNLRGSGVHGGLIVFENGFNIDTMCSLLSIPVGRTLLRRHLSTFFKDLIGSELVQQKRQYQDSASNQQLNPLAEIKIPKKTPLWLSKIKSSKVGQDGLDEYLCPMYPVEPQIVKSSDHHMSDILTNKRQVLSKIPESINI